MSDRASAAHPATATKLQRARRDGIVPKSAALTSSVQLFLCIGALWTVLYLFPIDLAQATRDVWTDQPLNMLAADEFVSVVRLWLLATAKFLFSLGIGVVAAGVIANYAQTGPMFCPGRLGSGGAGGKRNIGEMFSWVAIARLALGCSKVVVVVAVAGVFLWSHRDRIFSASIDSADQMVGMWLTVYLQTSLVASLALAAIAVLDFAVTWVSFQDRMKMTDAEIREEQRQQEGDPTLRQSRRKRHRELHAAAGLRSILMAHPPSDR